MYLAADDIVQNMTPAGGLPFAANVSVWIVVGAVVTFMWWAISRVGPTVVQPGEELLSRRQKHWIIGGVSFLWVFSDWPVHQVAEEYLFFVHMIQHSVFTMIVPACFLMGAPTWMWRWALENRPWTPVVRFFTRPLVALIVFNALIAYTHFPAIVNTSGSNGFFHFGVHVLLFLAALCMWTPVINRTPYVRQLKAPPKMMYLFAQSLVPTVPASLLTFAQTPTYQHYINAPRLIGDFAALPDQVWAAAIMKIGVGTYLWAIVAFIWFSWYRDSQLGKADDHVLQPKPMLRPRTLADDAILEAARRNGVDADGLLTWDQVKGELDRLDRLQTPTQPRS
jgi:putative membrane protein